MSIAIGTAAPQPHPGDADAGDVGPEELGLGYTEQELELVEQAEELSIFDSSSAADPDGELPDEQAALSGGGVAEEAVPGGADGGESEELFPGFSPDELRRAEESDELEVGVPAAAPLPAPAPAPAPAAETTVLVAQNTRRPTRKVRAAGLGGLVAAIPVPLLTVLDSVAIPETVATVVTATLTLLGSLASAYLARETAGA
jgi:hypothetical protein